MNPVIVVTQQGRVTSDSNSPLSMKINYEIMSPSDLKIKMVPNSFESLANQLLIQKNERKSE